MNLTVERGAKSPGSLEQMLRQYLHVREHGHEARVAVPARDNVQMDVVLDPGAGNTADVPAEVEAVRRVLGTERVECARREAMHLGRLRIGERAEVIGVPLRGNEHMPGRVGELV